jgi:hypothetical protein
MKLKTTFENKPVLLFLIFLIAAGVTYLSRISQIGYLNDDWYLMYAGHAYGADSFSAIYSVDRPMRALVMTPAYNLFGDNVLYYNLSALVFRVISALCFLWLLRMLWIQQRAATFLSAVLFFVYPGFLSQLNGIDYQSQMVSLAAGMLSIALSMKASFLQKPLAKILLLVCATALGWFYLGLVKYFIGFEALRLAAFVVIANRNANKWTQKLIVGIRNWLPNIIIPAGFLIWRVFFFESQRGATDIGSQLGAFTESPPSTGLWWLVRLCFNALDVTFLAWGVPFYQLSAYLTRLRDVFTALLSVGILIGLTLWHMRASDDETANVTESDKWKHEAFALGILVVFAGLLPVILVNRQADFTNFTRYTLASSGGAALILTAILYSISSSAVRSAGISLLLAASVFTHQANSLRLSNETASLRSFWWQVAWRAPHIEMDTALIANYPLGSIQEDYFVWGPANMLYYRNGIEDDQIRVGITAIVLNSDSLLNILSGGEQSFGDRRSIRTIVNYRKILVLTKPTTESCVQVIDGSQPVYSQFEEERIMLIGTRSDLNNIRVDAEGFVPAEIVFGPEPPHEWCYYYEKASLAIQRKDWNEALRLGEEVLKNDFTPGDPIEWVPFLQAYARARNVEGLAKIKRLMNKAKPTLLSSNRCARLCMPCPT